ncbi:UPF0606 protein [Lates japonicus]|uniref:UPF0606 protein n=1 Tax=Lates japonicus TaxID=270547 RepID=A0AAD3N916_LATJO|nr:UPF0606 protein [Lates japonicus]
MAPKHALLSSSGSSGLGVGGINVKEDPCSASPTAWIPDAGMVAVCTPRNGKRKRSLSGMMARWPVIIGAVLMLMMQSSLAADAEGDHHESVRQAVLPLDPAVPSNLSATPRIGAKDKDGMDGTDVGPRAWPEGKVFAEARTAVWTETEAGMRAGAASNRDSQTAGSGNVSLVAVTYNSSSSNSSFSLEESMSSLPAWDLPTVPESLLSTVGDHDVTLPANVTSPFSTHQWNTTMPVRTRNTSRHTTTSSTTIKTSLSPTTTSTLLLSTTARAQTPSESTTASNSASQDTVTSDNLQLTTVTMTTPSTTTLTVTTDEVTMQVATTVPVTTVFIPGHTTPSPTTTTEPPSSTTAEEGPLPCNVTEKYWVRSVLSIELRRNRLDLILKQNLSKGLSHALQRALNDSTAYAQVEHDDCSPHNVTLGYYVASGKTVYISSLVVEALNVYGFDKLLSDIRQHIPLVKAVLVPVATWVPTPSIHLQLKTVLRFVGPTDNIYSCSFVQMLEQRLENAFDEAQDKVLETYNRLTVEIQSVSQEPGSPSVTVVYMVKNQDAILNGTISSGLLNQLTAELVGYFLFYPPLVIAELLEYHNSNTSTATKNYNGDQDVDSSSLRTTIRACQPDGAAAELFVAVGTGSIVRSRVQHCRGLALVQMVSSMRGRDCRPKNPAEMTYAQLNGAPITEPLLPRP